MPVNSKVVLMGAALIVLAACAKPAATTSDPSSAAAPEASAEASGATASALPQVAIVPEAFRGHWDLDAAACADDKEPLRITEGGLDYWEDSSTSRSIEVLSPTHIRIKTDDYGEETSDLKPGESTLKGHTTWDLTLLDDGKTLKDITRPGQTILRIRCET